MTKRILMLLGFFTLATFSVKAQPSISDAKTLKDSIASYYAAKMGPALHEIFLGMNLNRDTLEAQFVRHLGENVKFSKEQVDSVVSIFGEFKTLKSDTLKKSELRQFIRQRRQPLTRLVGMLLAFELGSRFERNYIDDQLFVENLYVLMNRRNLAERIVNETKEYKLINSHLAQTQAYYTPQQAQKLAEIDASGNYEISPTGLRYKIVKPASDTTKIEHSDRFELSMLLRDMNGRVVREKDGEITMYDRFKGVFEAAQLAGIGGKIEAYIPLEITPEWSLFGNGKQPKKLLHLELEIIKKSPPSKS